MSRIIPSHGLVLAFLSPFVSEIVLEISDQIFKANREDLKLEEYFHPQIA